MALTQPKLLLPTSTAGSLPKPSWLAEPEKLWSAWKLEGEELLDRVERGELAVKQGKWTEENFIKPYQDILNEWAA
ncbi:hypothetical protein BUV99_12980, partial [Corynebacterium diphtheriae]